MPATNDHQSESRPRTGTAEERVEELTARLRAALEGLDRGRALYIVVSSLLGDELDKERVVANPDTGKVFGYLLPPGDRHALFAAARPAARYVIPDPPVTLDELLGRFSRCMDPVPTTVAE